MKSAYELAMERLAKESPETSAPLTEEQKQELQAIDQKYKARIAEKEVFLQKQIADARRQRDRTALEQLERQLHNERTRLQDECERAKNKVRSAE